jgi:uncharacterized protein YpuA (DUF1002 family)
VSYVQYGIDPALVERIKLKLKRPDLKERVKMILNGVTKQDLQDRPKVTKLVDKLSKALGENMSATQTNAVINFVIAQKIDPNNTFHLIKLWGMFR